MCVVVGNTLPVNLILIAEIAEHAEAAIRGRQMSTIVGKCERALSHATVGARPVNPPAATRNWRPE